MSEFHFVVVSWLTTWIQCWIDNEETAILKISLNFSWSLAKKREKTKPTSKRLKYFVTKLWEKVSDFSSRPKKRLNSKSSGNHRHHSEKKNFGRIKIFWNFFDWQNDKVRFDVKWKDFVQILNLQRASMVKPSNFKGCLPREAIIVESWYYCGIMYTYISKTYMN